MREEKWRLRRCRRKSLLTGPAVRTGSYGLYQSDHVRHPTIVETCSGRRPYKPDSQGVSIVQLLRKRQRLPIEVGLRGGDGASGSPIATPCRRCVDPVQGHTRRRPSGTGSLLRRRYATCGRVPHRKPILQVRLEIPTVTGPHPRSFPLRPAGQQTLQKLAFRCASHRCLDESAGG